MPAPFYIIAAVTVASAIAAMSLRNLVHCVLCLVLTFVGLAALYLQLDAQFVGLAQVLVYVGAVAILIVFAILLTRGDEKAPGIPVFSASWWAGLMVSLVVITSLAAAIKSSSTARAAKPTPPTVAVDSQASAATVKNIGVKLLSRSENYLLPLEVTGLLLTAAMIGAAVIAMPEGRRR